MSAKLIRFLLLTPAFTSALILELVNQLPNKQVFVQFQQTADFVAPSGDELIILASDNAVTHYLPEVWQGQIWGRIDCYENCTHLPTNRIDLKIRKNITNYSISLLAGFNLNVSISPVDGIPLETKNPRNQCESLYCRESILEDCPEALQTKNENAEIVACQSACESFGSDKYCCLGRRETCRPETWPINYSEWFSRKCPNAYNIVFEKNDKTFSCITDTYLITFG